MSSIAPFLIKRPNSKNLHPITIRIIKNRKASYIYLGQAIKTNQWDEKNARVKRNHPDYLEINQLILTKLSIANKNLLKSEIEEDDLSSIEIKNKVTLKEKDDFFGVSQEYLMRIKQRKQFHQHDVQLGRIKVLQTFIKKDHLSFKAINKELLHDFEFYLLNSKGLKKRTVANYMITIRAVYNLAISKSMAQKQNYPFGKGNYQIRFPESTKIGLNIQEIKKLEQARGLTKAQAYAVKAWLISFYFAGIRVSDVLQLKWSDFKGDRLYYRMNKNEKLVTLKVPDKVIELLKTMERDERSIYVFKELEGVNADDKKYLRTRIKTTTRNFNRRLELAAKTLNITKKLSMHIARHSFGNISGDRIPIQMLQKLYRHSSVTTTISYQSSFMNQDTDDALDKVIDF